MIFTVGATQSSPKTVFVIIFCLSDH